MFSVEQSFRRDTIERFVSYLPKLFYRRSIPLAVEGVVEAHPIPFADLAGKEFTSFQEGETWGPNWSSGWFRLSATVPDAWRVARRGGGRPAQLRRRSLPLRRCRQPAPGLDRRKRLPQALRA